MARLSSELVLQSRTDTKMAREALRSTLRVGTWGARANPGHRLTNTLKGTGPVINDQNDIREGDAEPKRMKPVAVINGFDEGLC